MKSRAALNWMLVILLGLVAAAHFLIDLDSSQPGWVFLPEMVDSVAYDSFAANPVFADGKTVRSPVAGTIPRGLPPLPYHATEEDAQRAGRELNNPYSGEDRGAVARGAVQYRRMCAACHGTSGSGEGRVVQRGYPPPPSLLAPATRDLADGAIFHAITYGKGNMPSHAHQIDREDRWKIILHLRTLQARGVK